MKAKGFSHVICLTDNRPQYDPTPLTIAHAVKLEDLSHGEPPQNPKKEEHLIRQAVSAVAGKFFAGEGIIVHCEGGTGRTGTVIGCFLCAMGIPSSEVLAYLDGLNKSRGRRGWPESDWQKQIVERFQTDHRSR
jgi:protein-tyrosine phosphatase